MDKSNEPSSATQAVERGLAHVRDGGMLVLVDDHERENEGDLVIAAEHCRAEHINFMCKFGRGLVCLALSPARVAKLRLPMMVPTDPGSMGTAFTVSIEARSGVTTGISAADRARTVEVAVADGSLADDLVSPGHIFPLRAQAGGVLVRSGHTEGAVDLARLAGLRPAGVICEIMRDDGEMARMDDLDTFARVHDMPILAIADIIEYRLAAETLVTEIDHAPMASEVLGLSQSKGWSLRTFRSSVEPTAYYMAFCKGGLADARHPEPILVRAQRAQVLGDVFGFGGDSGARMRGALRQIDRAGRGVFMYVIEQELHGEVQRVLGQPPNDEASAAAIGLKPAESGFRQFGLGAQVLRSLGLKRIRVITNNPRKIIGLRGFGIEVTGSVPLEDCG